MWDYLKRQQLQRKGLSCGRKRRECSQSEWIETLRFSPFVRLLVLSVFVAGLGVLVRYLPQDAGFPFLQSNTGLGSAILLASLAVSFIYLKLEHPCTWESNSRVLLVYTTMLIQLSLLHLADFIVRLNGKDTGYALYFAPSALAPMTLCLLLGVEHGFFAVIFGAIWGAFIVQYELSFSYAILTLGTGLVGTLTTRHLRKRSQLMRAGLWVGLAGVGLCLLVGKVVSPADLWAGDGWHEFGIAAGSLLLAGIFTATVVNGLLPVLEGLFKITTTISWIELSDLNHPLLRRMTLEAPGTYHHSLMVASLSESAAEAIGADPTVCRVCSYFHDIGKLERPEYCIENIHGDENPHDDLSPTMSALIILSHVKDGVDLALKYKLNQQIIDAIQQHHGTSLVWFFYRRAVDHQEEVKKEVAAGRASATDIPEVTEKEFRYAGPKPQTRESAIISLADAVESASRVLTKPTPQKIEQLVDEIVASRLRDGQLDECDLTLAELERIRVSFENSLRTMLHRRIPYPEEKTREDRQREKDYTDKNRPDPPPPPKGSGSDRTQIWDRPHRPKVTPVSTAAKQPPSQDVPGLGTHPAS